MKYIFLLYIANCNGFGGLGVACWPLIPKFAGLDPAEAVGFLGRKNPQSHVVDLRHVKDP